MSDNSGYTLLCPMCGRYHDNIGSYIPKEIVIKELEHVSLDVIGKTVCMFCLEAPAYKLIRSVRENYHPVLVASDDTSKYFSELGLEIDKLID